MHTATTPTAPPDPESVAEFAQQVVERLAAGWFVVVMHFGDRLGLYGALAEGAGTADEIAARAATNPRLTREWLDGQVAAGIVRCHDGRYRLPSVHAVVLAAHDSPAFLAAAGGVLAAVVQAEDQITSAFHGDGGLAWDDQAPCLAHAVDRFYQPGYAASLIDEWIGSLDGAADVLAAGGRVVDVGCGRGTALMMNAESYPNTVCVGIDNHDDSMRPELASPAGRGDGRPPHRQPVEGARLDTLGRP